MRTPVDLLSLLEIRKYWALKCLIFKKGKKNKTKMLLCDTGMEKPGKVVLLPFNRGVAWEAPEMLFLVFAFTFLSWTVLLFHASKWRSLQRIESCSPCHGLGGAGAWGEATALCYDREGSARQKRVSWGIFAWIKHGNNGCDGSNLLPHFKQQRLLEKVRGRRSHR